MLQCCTWPPDWLHTLLKMTPHVVYFSYLVHFGNYVLRLVSPVELKITHVLGARKYDRQISKVLVILEL